MRLVGLLLTLFVIVAMWPVRSGRDCLSCRRKTLRKRWWWYGGKSIWMGKRREFSRHRTPDTNNDGHLDSRELAALFRAIEDIPSLDHFLKDRNRKRHLTSDDVTEELLLEKVRNVARRNYAATQTK